MLMQWKNVHLLWRVKLDDHIAAAMKTLPMLLPATGTKFGTVGKKMPNITMPPVCFLLSVIIQNNSGRRPLHYALH